MVGDTAMVAGRMTAEAREKARTLAFDRLCSADLPAVSEHFTSPDFHAALTFAATLWAAGNVPAVNDAMTGRVLYAFAPGPNAIPLAKAGKLQILATTSPAGASARSEPRAQRRGAFGLVAAFTKQLLKHQAWMGLGWQRRSRAGRIAPEPSWRPV